jgi:hypothetical protein
VATKDGFALLLKQTPAVSPRKPAVASVNRINAVNEDTLDHTAKTQFFSATIYSVGEIRVYLGTKRTK